MRLAQADEELAQLARLAQADDEVTRGDEPVFENIRDCYMYYFGQIKQQSNDVR